MITERLTRVAHIAGETRETSSVLYDGEDTGIVVHRRIRGGASFAGEICGSAPRAQYERREDLAYAIVRAAMAWADERE